MSSFFCLCTLLIFAQDLVTLSSPPEGFSDLRAVSLYSLWHSVCLCQTAPCVTEAPSSATRMTAA